MTLLVITAALILLGAAALLLKFDFPVAGFSAGILGFILLCVSAMWAPTDAADTCRSKGGEPAGRYPYQICVTPDGKVIK